MQADASGHLMDTFLGFHRKMGWTFSNTLLGGQSWGTVEPRNLEAMMSTNFEDWGLGPRHPIMFPAFGDGIFVQEGPAWKHSREILRPQFNHSQYDDMELFEEAVKDLFAAIDIAVENDGGVLDVQPLFFKLTLDTTTAFLFGESVTSLRDKQSEEQGQMGFAQAFNEVQIHIQQRFRLGDFYWMSGGKKFRAACKAVHSFADRLIDHGLNREKTNHVGVGEKKKYVFLDTVAEAVKTRDALRGQTINILAAGRDTTAGLLSWVFFLLVRHPLVLLNIRREIHQATSNGEAITRTMLRNMTYLQHALKEALRLFPTVPLNTRTALRDTILPLGGGPDGASPLLIPKGGNVAFGVYTMHRRPDLYGLDAEIFRPERWDDPDLPLKKDKSLERWGYLPFNGGPRVCLGMDFAMVEAAFVVVKLLQRYSIIEIAEGEKIEIVGTEKQLLTLTLQVGEGVRLKLGQ
ncbi:cytochrome P450 alkane hydroxylase [Venturia nashicola]|uniref:Cytochrome P450 alkane hydroxylase n=1 Tax=Venturia nashicola TaxID=86259 RepID=A0A4Z1P6L6_9PEZI|nr:cytochrome P450 alkane hydroxylase [Venturia nashicola]